MNTIRKNWVKVIISFLIAVLGIICIYSLATYKSNTSGPMATGNFNSSNRPNFKSNGSSNKNAPNAKQNSEQNGPNNNQAQVGGPGGNNQGGAPSGNGSGGPGGNDQGGGPNGGGPNDSQNGSSSNKSQNMGPSSNKSSSSKNQKSATKGQMPKGPRMGMPNMGGSSSDTNYSPVILAYALAFFVLIIAAYLTLIRKKIKISNENRNFIVIGVLIIGLLFRIIAGLNITGYSMDLNLYQNWASSAAKNLLNVYSSNRAVDYPPVYLYVLFIVGKLASLSFMTKYYVLLLKLPSILIDIASTYFIFKIAKKYFSFEISALLAAFYLFNPAILIDSTIWGQADSFFTFLVILGVYFLCENKIIQASAFFAISVLMKPQGIIFLPLLLFWYIKERNLQSFLKSIASGMITALIVLAPFSIAQGNITWIFKLYMKEVSEYPYASNNAFNFYTLIGANRVKDSTTMFLFSYHTWGMTFIVLVTLLSGILYFKSKNRYTLALAAFIQITGVFNFSVGMHERYMFTAVLASILAFIYLKDKRLLLLSVFLSVTNFLNMHLVLFNQAVSQGTGSNNSILSMMISLLNVAAFIYLVKVSVDICLKKELRNNNTLKH